MYGSLAPGLRALRLSGSVTTAHGLVVLTTEP